LSISLRKMIEDKIKELELLNEEYSKKGHMWNIYGGYDLMEEIEERIELLKDLLK
jgi:hypothetical protein